jgi:hypothetical protein
LRRLFFVQFLVVLIFGAGALWMRWQYLNSPEYRQRQLMAQAPALFDSIPTVVGDWVEVTTPEQRGWTTPQGIAIQERVFRKLNSDAEVVATIAFAHPRDLRKLQHVPSCLFDDLKQVMGIVETDAIEVAPVASKSPIKLGTFRVERPAASPDWDPARLAGRYLSHPSQPRSYVWGVGIADAWDAPGSERMFYGDAPRAVKLIVGAPDAVGADAKASAAESQQSAADFAAAIMPVIHQAAFAE